MADVNGLLILGIAVMAAITVLNHLYETGSKR